MNIETITKLGVNENVAKKVFDAINKYVLQEIDAKTKLIEKDFLEQLEKAKFDLLVEKEIISFGAKNVLSVKALIDEDCIKGLDLNKVKANIEQLKNNPETSFLFNHDNQTNQNLKGIKPFESNLKKTANIKDMNYEELCNYYDGILSI